MNIVRLIIVLGLVAFMVIDLRFSLDRNTVIS